MTRDSGEKPTGLVAGKRYQVKVRLNGVRCAAGHRHRMAPAIAARIQPRSNAVNSPSPELGSKGRRRSGAGSRLSFCQPVWARPPALRWRRVLNCSGRQSDFVQILCHDPVSSLQPCGKARKRSFTRAIKASRCRAMAAASACFCSSVFCGGGVAAAF